MFLYQHPEVTNLALANKFFLMRVVKNAIIMSGKE